MVGSSFLTDLMMLLILSWKITINWVGYLIISVIEAHKNPLKIINFAIYS